MMGFRLRQENLRLVFKVFSLKQGLQKGKNYSRTSMARTPVGP